MKKFKTPEEFAEHLGKVAAKGRWFDFLLFWKKRCPVCKRIVPRGTKECPHCGTIQP